MTKGIHEQAASDATKEHFDVQTSERRVWTAVLLQALEDWRYGNLRRQREAEKFFFDSEEDFTAVCRRAGLEPSSVLAKLQRMRVSVPKPLTTPAWSRNLTLPAAA
jgi:hypothetical protein